MKTRVITFEYIVRDREGRLLDQSAKDSPMVYLEGSPKLIKGLRDAFLDLNKGDEKKVSVSMEDAFGQRDESFVRKIDRASIPTMDIKVGDRFRNESGEDSRIYIVVQITETEVILDGNHPLSGIDLYFELKVLDIRDATQEEIEREP